MSTQAELDRLYAQRNRLLNQAESIDAQLGPLENKVNQGIQLTTSEAQRYFDLSETQESINENIYSIGTRISNLKTQLQSSAVQQNSSTAIDPAVSPAAAQADATAEQEVGFFGRLFGTADEDVDVSEFGEYGSDLATPPPEPQPTPAPEPQEPVDLDLFDEGSDVTVTEESTIIRDPEALDRIETAIVGTAEPTFQDDVATGFGSFAEDEDAPGLDVAGGSVTSIPPRVDDTQAKQQQIVPDVQDQEDTVDFPVEEQQAQINQAALDRLRQQSAVQQNREPEGTGDWRVKLRLASGANYFYNAIAQAGDDVERTAGILTPLQATDGIVFPYTPSIQILYAADYNQYHPTHSNYQHYFYKGSKVGEVVLTATFTAQDTAEANYLLAVIHFLKSASKMFYGQDPERGSPPPLLFLSGLGDYQFNEAPCVISQFNYILPNDVDYIRANVSQIRAGETLQTNLRNRNDGRSLTSWSSSINRILSTPGLTIGAENTTSRISSKTANLSTDQATYVPTKIEMTITLLPVQNRLQVSEQFSLRDYANGKLIKGGFW